MGAWGRLRKGYWDTCKEQSTVSPNSTKLRLLGYRRDVTGCSLLLQQLEEVTVQSFSQKSLVEARKSGEMCTDQC